MCVEKRAFEYSSFPNFSDLLLSLSSFFDTVPPSLVFLEHKSCKVCICICVLFFSLILCAYFLLPSPIQLLFSLPFLEHVSLSGCVCMCALSTYSLRVLFLFDTTFLSIFDASVRSSARQHSLHPGIRAAKREWKDVARSEWASNTQRLASTLSAPVGNNSQ